MQIIRYNNVYKKEWDSFVRNSKNGTFLLCRDFMDYHSDRFADYSLMIFDEDVLVALLPANINNNVVYSHQGLTYGGFILNNNIRSVQVLDVFKEMIYFLRNEKIETFIYKTIPYIYHRQPSEEDLYALFRSDAKLISRSISSAIDLSCKIGYNQLRKRKIKQAIKQGVSVSETENFSEFWNILDENLSAKHNTKPVHTLDEIKLLKEKFPNEIRLFCAEKENKVIAGCLVFETDKVAHIQYISANEEGKKCGALDLLFDKLISETFSDKRYFDFGISTENGGLLLNEGLISQKEGFGGRGVVYDTYSLNLNES